MSSNAFTGNYTLKKGDGADPEVFTVVPELFVAPVTGTERERLNVSSFDSVGNNDYIASHLGDGIDVDMEWNLVLGNAEQIALRNDVNNGVTRNFEETWVQGAVTLTRTYAITLLGWNDTPSFEDKHVLRANGVISGDIVDVYS